MRSHATLALVLLFWCFAGAAQAAPLARLHVSLAPNRLGVSTTISFSFSIQNSGGGLPPALTALDVRLPPGMIVDTAGLAACARRQLAKASRRCPPNSQVGSGTVRVEVPLGDVTRPETAALSVFNSEVQDGRRTLLFVAIGRVPIATRLLFTGVLNPSAAGLKIEAAIPLIPTLPESPDAAIIEMSSTLGTRQVAYYRYARGKRVRFHPPGAMLPVSCPTGGMSFTGGFGFNDASTASSQATVACPAA